MKNFIKEIEERIKLLQKEPTDINIGKISELTLIVQRLKVLIVPVVSLPKGELLLCTTCNGEGGFQFSVNPDDCDVCLDCNGRGTK